MKNIILMILIFLFANCLTLEYENICPYSRNPVSVVAIVKDIDLIETYKTIAIVDLNSELLPKIEENIKIQIEENLVSAYESNLRSIGFIVAERRALEDVIEEQALSLTGVLSDIDAVKVGEILAVKAIALIDVYICGYENETQLYRQSIKIIDVETGEIVANGEAINVVGGTTYLVNLIFEQNILNRIIRNNVLGTEYLKSSDYDSAQKCYEQMHNDILLFNELEKKNVLDNEIKKVSTIFNALVYNNLGALNKLKGNWLEAISLLKKSIIFINEHELDNPALLTRSYYHLCDVYVRTENYKKAIEYGIKGQNICTKNELIQQECEFIQLLKVSYLNLNKTKKMNKLIQREKEIFCK